MLKDQCSCEHRKFHRDPGSNLVVDVLYTINDGYSGPDKTAGYTKIIGYVCTVCKREWPVIFAGLSEQE